MREYANRSAGGPGRRSNPFRGYFVTLPSHITSLKSTTVHIAVPLHLNPACLSLRKGPSMKPSELFEALHALITERVPLHIWARAVWASRRSLRRSPLI
jgi:hypothetical protein